MITTGLARTWRRLIGAGQHGIRPDLCLMRREALKVARERLQRNDPRLTPAAQAIVSVADRCLSKPIYRITGKKRLPPSGDPKDFFSIGTYWWPNPDTEDGLPYIRRDGRVNPESMESDTGKVRQLCRESRLLSLAWWLTGEARYAQHCAALLKAWFVDPAHAMNPHLTYAQSVPGVSDGRSYGIIDTRGFRYLVDAATLILDEGTWTVDDQDHLRDWMSKFLNWLLSSRPGRKENAASNNHGTWYSAQALSLALFCGERRLADKLASDARGRIAAQVAADGTQSAEFERSRPLTYCTMNLWAFFEVATLAEHTAVDLWSYEAPSGASLKQAAFWLLPYVQRKRDWPEREIIEYKPEHYLSLFRRAAIQYDEMFEPEGLPLNQDAVRKSMIQVMYPVSSEKQS